MLLTDSRSSVSYGGIPPAAWPWPLEAPSSCYSNAPSAAAVQRGGSYSDDDPLSAKIDRFDQLLGEVAAELSLPAPPAALSRQAVPRAPLRPIPAAAASQAANAARDDAERNDDAEASAAPSAANCVGHQCFDARGEQGQNNPAAPSSRARQHAEGESIQGYGCVLPRRGA